MWSKRKIYTRKHLLQSGEIYNWISFYPENENALPGYLYRIAKNKWLDYLRSGHYQKVVALTESAEEAKEDAELTELIKKSENTFRFNTRRI